MRGRKAESTEHATLCYVQILPEAWVCPQAWQRHSLPRPSLAHGAFNPRNHHHMNAHGQNMARLQLNDAAQGSNIYSPEPCLT